MRRALLLICVTSFSCSAVFAQGMKDQMTSAKRSDDSDWWSLTRDVSGTNIKPQKRVPAASNFSILGIHLGESDDSAQIVGKLGKAAFVSRGDAASGRIQACYVSPENSPSIYLIFEQGEVDNVFYCSRMVPIGREATSARSPHWFPPV